MIYIILHRFMPPTTTQQINVTVTQHPFWMLHLLTDLAFSRTESLFLPGSLPCSMSPSTADNAIFPNTQLWSHLRLPTHPKPP